MTGSEFAVCGSRSSILRLCLHSITSSELQGRGERPSGAVAATSSREGCPTSTLAKPGFSESSCCPYICVSSERLLSKCALC